MKYKYIYIYIITKQNKTKNQKQHGDQIYDGKKKYNIQYRASLVEFEFLQIEKVVV